MGLDEDHLSRTGGPAVLFTRLQPARAREVKHEQATWLEGVTATHKHEPSVAGLPAPGAT
jgi:hypothetical protein